MAASSGAQNETGSGKRSTHDNPQNAASAAPQAGLGSAAANATASALGSATLGGGPAFSVGPVSMGRLAETLASQATGFVSQAAASASAPAGTASVAGSQPVKELEIQLDPADLGAMSVKMRLTDGKLSVVVEVSKPSTLKAVESDRDVIAQRLGSSVQALESLTIKPSAANSQTAGEGADASGQRPEGRDNAQSEARNSSGNSQSGRQAPRRDGSADQGSRQQPSYEPVAGRGFGDMRV